MTMPPFPRHEWRPTPIGYEPIPQRAHMTYGHPREGVITTYGWRADGGSQIEYDTFRVCLPDTITVIPVIRTTADMTRCGAKGNSPSLPLLGLQHRQDVNAIQFANAHVGLMEDPRSAVHRILLEKFNLTAKHATPVLVHQPDPRVDSLNYTFLVFDPSIASTVSVELETPTCLVHARQIFADTAEGVMHGEHEFVSRVVLTHGHANCSALFAANVTNSTTAYSMMGGSCQAWLRHRGTPLRTTVPPATAPVAAPVATT